MRVAIVFDDRPRPETTGTYCLRALKKIADVRHFYPDQLESITGSDFDLFLNIDDGLRYAWRSDLTPSACWIIDTHVDYAWSLQKSRQFDLVFAAQRDGAAKLVADGISSARWLPLAADPDIHCHLDSSKQFDVCFVGNLFDGPRTDLLRLIRQYYPNTFVGQKYFDDMARTYAESRVVFNCSIQNDINMRVFEALSCGGFLLTNDLSQNGQRELFQDGVHLATYSTGEELLDKLRFYLDRQSIRERIAAQGMAEVLARHTYAHRMREILRQAQSLTEAAAVSFTPTSLNECQELRSTDEPAELKPNAQAAQDGGYFEFARPELLERIPVDAKSILELGCGAGRLGESVKMRQRAHYVGIELDAAAAEQARTRLDQVIEGDIESLETSFAEGQFDCIVCGDVLEHLQNPVKVLRRLRQWLKPAGTLVVSLPNVQHHSVVASLVEGNWTYEPAGILDDTHRHFFTRQTIEQMFYRAGYSIKRLSAVYTPEHAEWLASKKTDQVRVGRLYLAGLEPGEAEAFFVYQYLVEAAPEPQKQFDLTSIVILTHNELAYTQECLESIRRYTDEPYELIVVDNGSTDGTVEFLRKRKDIQLIENSENLGFPAAVNQGLAIAQGKQLLLLNNDVVITTGWLRRMLEILELDPQVGLVGPVTNCTSGEQRIRPDYDHLEQLESFAWEWAGAQPETCRDAAALMGFCLLFRREVLDKVGTLDERFGVGVYEDVDFCLRAQKARYRTVIACQAYVHHHGHRTFIGQSIDADHWLQRNQQLFADKWKADGASETAGAALLTADSDQSASELVRML